MKKNKKTEYLGLRVSPEEKAGYKALSKSLGYSVGRMIRTAVRLFMIEGGLRNGDREISKE